MQAERVEQVRQAAERYLPDMTRFLRDLIAILRTPASEFKKTSGIDLSELQH